MTRRWVNLPLLSKCFIAPGFLPWIDNYAHVFGLVGGICLSFSLLPYVELKTTPLSPVVRGVLQGVSVAFFVLLLLSSQLLFYLVPEFECEVRRLWSLSHE